MTAHKHMEALFGAAAIAALLVAALPHHDSGAVARQSPASATPSTNAIEHRKNGHPQMAQTAVQVSAVVVIKGKRMTARERRRAALASLGAPARS